MPPSQLKRLKASLRENGITGPQKSKKAIKQQKKGGADLRNHRQNALANLREEFNPFEVKAPNRPRKFEVTTNRPNENGVLGRPGVSKSMGEEARRRTLLPEMHRRNKTGGIVDRRIGENDPTMAPEERALQRFTREKSKKKGAIFDLEDDIEEEGLLTHAGKAITFDDENGADDFDVGSIGGASDEDEDFESLLSRKRLREEDGEDVDGEAPDQPDRKKSKAEVMKEVIAKSKLHKYERQQAKEADDDLREELDKQLPDLLALIRGQPTPKPKPAPEVNAPHNGDFAINPDRAALLAGMDRDKADKEYDMRMRQMREDKKAKPTTRTKTDEEIAQDEADRLKDLDDKRQRRMRGEEVSEDEAPANAEEGFDDEDEEDVFDEAAEFGLSNVHPTSKGATSRPEGMEEDEDDFVLDDLDDDDVIEGDSDLDEDEEGSDAEESEAENQDDFEFVAGQYTTGANDTELGSKELAFTYPCPQTHEELLEIVKDVPVTDLPTIIQRIRALYAPQLAAGNKEKLGIFATVLVDHISYMASTKPAAPLPVIETIIRHIHSLSRTHPDTVGNAFRSHLRKLQQTNTPTPGDLVILTAIGTIFPPSDHFHQVITPAITLMTRWLGLTTPQSVQDLSTAAYLGALCLKYQALSKRYVPELLRSTTLCLKFPNAPQDLLDAHVKNLLTMADLWSTKSAFAEIFTPNALAALSKLPKQRTAIQRLKIHLEAARNARRPLELHHHRPIAIKTFLPKFEESFDPTKHYDPDKERSDARKLQKEYKKERKGAMRELRKDANFIARQQLQEKKEKDRAYEEKYRKLVASIQAEEGQAGNEYERVRRARKGGR